jgi:peroxiredoxin
MNKSFILGAAFTAICFSMVALDMTSSNLVAIAIAEELKVGAKAPDFSLNDLSGNKRSLSEFAGKIVVLEWFNAGCPFVKKHYESGNMQKLQSEFRSKDVVWLSVNSSAKDKQGHATPELHLAKQKEWKSEPTAFLIDESGEVGKAYGAKTTPHIFIVNKEGKVAYMGAIDDKPSVEQEDIATSKNYISSALDELLAGKEVSINETRAYGCGVKY